MRNLRSRDYLPTYLPIYGKPLHNYFHIWVDHQVAHPPTYHLLDRHDPQASSVFPWSLNVFLAFFMLSGWFGQAKWVERGPETATLLTNYACNRRVTAIVSRQRAQPPTYLPQRVFRVRIWVGERTALWVKGRVEPKRPSPR